MREQAKLKPRYVHTKIVAGRYNPKHPNRKPPVVMAHILLQFSTDVAPASQSIKYLLLYPFALQVLLFKNYLQKYYPASIA